MMSATMLSGKVIWCEGSAASRRRMVEYWLWSATHMSTGFGEYTNGSQNCLSTGGREKCHSVAAAITIVSAPSANACILRAGKFRFVRGTSGSVATGGALTVSALSLDNSRETAAAGPLGCPGQ